MGVGMRAVVVGLEKKESVSDSLSQWRGVGCGGVQVDCGFFSWRYWEDGEAMNRNEEVKNRTLRSSVWDTQGSGVR